MAGRIVSGRGRQRKAASSIGTGRLPAVEQCDAVRIHDGVAVQQRHVSVLRSVEYVGLAEHVGCGGGLQVETEVSEIEHWQGERSCKGGGGEARKWRRGTPAAHVKVWKMKKREVAHFLPASPLTPQQRQSSQHYYAHLHFSAIAGTHTPYYALSQAVAVGCKRTAPQKA